jgi:hypothetical protein
MFRLIVVLAFTSFFVTDSYSQIDSAKEKRFNHYAGFQANLLIKQIINLNNNNTAINNPYLFTYAINHVKTGYGLHVGFGYDYNRVVTNNTQASRETKVDKLFYRIGVEKKYTLSKRFECGIGLDFTASREVDKTFSISVTNVGSGVDSAVTTVTEKTTSTGYGPQLSLGFHITEKIILGTEATFYFSAEKQNENVNIIDTFTDTFSNQKTVTSTNQNSGADTDNFDLAIPTALFLIVKF